MAITIHTLGLCQAKASITMRQGGAYVLYFIYFPISKPDAVGTDRILFIPQSEYDPSLTSRPSKSVQTNGSIKTISIYMSSWCGMDIGPFFQEK